MKTQAWVWGPDIVRIFVRIFDDEIKNHACSHFPFKVTQGKVSGMSTKPYPSLRLFKSDLLERFSHVHPITPLILWAPIIFYFVSRALTVHFLSLWLAAAVFISGVLFWTLTEYLLHRYVFHFMGQSKISKRFVFIIHGLHHEDPNDPTRLVMPTLPAIILGIFFYLFFKLIIGTVYHEGFFAGFIMGYLIYDYTHYSVHHFKIKSKLGKFLKQAHMDHHFIYHEKGNIGVSSPLWDLVFGTWNPKKNQ